MLYLDANVIIRFIKGTSAIRAPLAARIGRDPVLTSQFSRLECRGLPLRQSDITLLKQYDDFFQGQEMTVAEVNQAVIDKATDLRARHNFKSPDAIHLATAIVGGASAFITGDVKLTQCTEISVEII